MSRQGGSNKSRQQSRKYHFWTPPTAADREVIAGVDRAYQKRIFEEEDTEEYGDSTIWLAAKVMMLEVTDETVFVVQRSGLPTAPIPVPRSMIGNEHELEDLIYADGEVLLLVRRNYALRRGLR